MVHLFHAQAPLHAFDLIITLPQYRLPERDNVLHLSGALNRIQSEKLEQAAADWRAQFAALPQPQLEFSHIEECASAVDGISVIGD